MRVEIIRAHIICCDCNNTEIPDGYIILQDEKIEDIGKGPLPESLPGATRIDAHGNLVIPGLINAHTHSYANIVRGLTPPLPLELWMVYSGAASQTLTGYDNYLSTLLGCIDMVRTGTTTYLDHIHVHKSLEPLEQAARASRTIGVRTVLAPMVADMAYLDCIPLTPNEKAKLKDSPLSGGRPIEELIEITESALLRCVSEDGLTRAMVGYTGPHRCSEKFILACHELAQRHKVGVHAHLLETRFQNDPRDVAGADVVSSLKNIGVLNDRVSFAHGVWLSRMQAKILAEGGCSVIHNPYSNLYLGSGVARTIMLRDLGINIALGTDGSNLSGTQSVLKSMNLASVLQNTQEGDYLQWLKPSEVMGWATVGGAKALVLADELGSLEKGKKADLVILNSNTHALVPLHNGTESLVNSETGISVDTVIVNGSIIFQDGKFVNFDEHALLHEVKKRAPFIKKEYDKNLSKLKNEIEVVSSMYQRLQMAPDRS
jgi:5-methylthioadenosine/S-adenosylhomocysteine deaminase